MSIDINWETLTTGPDGQELAHSIRDFIHAKFQAVPLPRFIKSVTVHDFEFGAIPPSLELKDITDPLPDFYEENSEAGSSSDENGSGSGEDDDDAASFTSADELRLRSRMGKKANGNGDGNSRDKAPLPPRLDRYQSSGQHNPYFHHLPPHLQTSGLGGAASPGLRGSMPDLGSPFLGVSTPGIPGGTSNFSSYFHSHLTGSLSGTQTPLAAVAGAHHWPEGAGPSSGAEARAIPPGGGHGRHPSQSSVLSDYGSPPVPSPNPGTGLTPSHQPHPLLREKHSVSTLAPTSVGTSRPPTRDTSFLAGSAVDEDSDDQKETTPEPPTDRQGPEKKYREPRIEDMQAVFRIRYSGDVKLLLTADILLDYPMPSFVGIPVRLSITGLTFDGVGVLAHIRRRVHFCFLSPDDAVAAVGAESEDDEGGASGDRERKGRMGGLLQEIKVDSEIGQREPGKQSLKNVGKVERFVLEQVRRIFEEEFVYPSFWTVLV